MSNQTEQTEWDRHLANGNLYGCRRLLEKHLYQRTLATKEIDQAMKLLPSIEATDEEKSDFLFMAVDAILADAITPTLIDAAARFATKETLFRLGMKCSDVELSELIAKVVLNERGEDFANQLINLYYDRADSRIDRERHIYNLLKMLLANKQANSDFWETVSNRVSMDHFLELGKKRHSSNATGRKELVTITRFFKVKPEPSCPCDGGLEAEDDDED